MRFHISSRSVSAVFVISTRYFAGTLEFPEEGTSGTCASFAHIVFGRRQEPGKIAGAEVFFVGPGINEDRVSLAVDREYYWPAGPSNLIQYLPGLALELSHRTYIVDHFHEHNLAHNWMPMKVLFRFERYRTCDGFYFHPRQGARPKLRAARMPIF